MSKVMRKREIKKGAALLLVGHGVKGPCAPVASDAHHNLVSDLRSLGKFSEIRWGYLTCEPYVEDVVESFDCEIIYVLPMFMSDGYFSRRLIPTKLGVDNTVSTNRDGQTTIQCMPVGLSHKMGEMIMDHVLAHCAANAIYPAEASLVVVGHGSSKDNASSLAMSAQVERLRNQGKFKEIYTAYLEEPPDLRTVLNSIFGKVLVVGYFANCGNHAMTDISMLLLGSSDDVSYLGPVGALPAMREIVLDCVTKTADF